MASSCSAGLTVYIYTKNVVSFIICIIAVVAIYQHIKYFKQKSVQLPCPLYCVIILFYIFIMIFGLSEAFINQCAPILSSYYVFFFLLSSGAWIFQMIMVIAILFMKLHYAFKGSIYKLPKSIIYGFSIIYAVYILSFLVALTSKITYIIYTIVFLILSTYLSTLFIYKLNQINIMFTKVTEVKTDIAASTSPDMVPSTSPDISAASNSDSDISETSNNDTGKDDDFLSIITKSTILTAITLLSSLIAMLFYMVAYVTGYINVKSMIYAWDFFSGFDVFANFLGVYLSTVYTEKYYWFCCGVCDRICKEKCLEYHQKQCGATKELANYVGETQKKEKVAV